MKTKCATRNPTELFCNLELLLDIFRFIVERKCRYLTTMLTYHCLRVLPDANEIRNREDGIINIRRFIFFTQPPTFCVPQLKLAAIYSKRLTISLL